MAFFRSFLRVPRAANSGSISTDKILNSVHHYKPFPLPVLEAAVGSSNFLHSLTHEIAFRSPVSVSRQILLGQKDICRTFCECHGSHPLPGFLTGFCRSIHGLVKTEFHVEAADGNTTSYSKQITEDAEKICRLLSTDSSIWSSLDQSEVKVSPELVVEVLKKLSNAGTLALSFFRWAESQEGFKHTTECFHNLIEALGKIKQFRLIWNLVEIMKDGGLLTKETFALITRRYARARKIKEAIETFERMERYGLKPDISDFNRLIDTLSKSKNVETAQEIFCDVKSRNRFSPDLKTYTILLEGWGTKLDLTRLTEIYQEMMDEGFEPDVVTYGILINAFVKSRKLEEALRLFHEMEARNFKASPHIYCTLINGMGSEKRLHEALKYFEQSKTSDFAAEIPTYNAVVGAYCWSHQFEDAYRMLAEMEQCGVEPNARTYEVILHHLIKAHRTEEAYQVFQRMGRVAGCDPGLNTYTMIVRMFCAEERLDMALKVWQQMNEKGIIPCMHMYSVLIDGLCYENRLEEACEYFQEMLDRGIRPAGQSYSNLKQALLDGGKKDLAVHMGIKLDKLRRTPLPG